MLRVTDLDRSIKFYTEALGMKLLRTRDNPDNKYKLAFLGNHISYHALLHHVYGLHMLEDQLLLLSWKDML